MDELYNRLVSALSAAESDNYKKFKASHHVVITEIFNEVNIILNQEMQE